MNRQFWAGVGLIVFSFYFNVPFSILASTFGYPEILRSPSADILQRFSDGGPGLIATWYSFMFAAVLLLPVTFIVRSALPAGGWLRPLSTTLGVAAALFQAVGLSRWVFVVPLLAGIEADQAASPAAREAAHVVFATLNQFAGVAIGEHLGQLFTAGWMLTVAVAQWRGAVGGRVAGGVGIAAVVLIVAGLAEGFATVLPFAVGPLGFASPLGYVLLSLWLIATGIALMRFSVSRAGARFEPAGEVSFRG